MSLGLGQSQSRINNIENKKALPSIFKSLSPRQLELLIALTKEMKQGDSAQSHLVYKKFEYQNFQYVNT